VKRRILLMFILVGSLALQAEAQWIGRMWGTLPGVDFIKSVDVPGGRATGFTDPDVGARVANQMQGYWQMCIENFTVPSYFEPFQTEQSGLLGQPYGKFVNDYMDDALDWTYDKFRYGDGLVPKYFRNQPPTIRQDGTTLGDPLWTIFADKGDQVISDLPADFMEPFEGFRAGGMAERSRLYAWQSPEQDDFFINVRSFGRPDPPYVPDQRAGAGKADLSPESSSANPVFDDFYLGMNFMLMGGNGQGPMAQVGQGQDSFGPTKLGEANLGALGRWDELYFYDDDAKMVYARDGDSAISSGFRSDGDDRGEPAPPAGHEALTLASQARISAGQFLESEYKAKVYLYVSKDPTTFDDFSDANNWLLPAADGGAAPADGDETAQPRAIKRVNNVNWVSSAGNTRSETFDWIVEPGTTRGERIMQSNDPADQQQALEPSTLQVTFGPFDLAVGQWIHVVEAWVVNGPHEGENKRVGADWASGAITFAEKEAFLDSGMDSLMASVALARQAWADRRVVNGTVNGNPSSWPIGPAPSLPLGPSWPATVDYNSGPSQNEIEWSSVSEAAGYNVYRMAGHETNLPDPPVPINGSSLVSGTSYIDTDVVRGERYFYAVTAVDADGQESSLFATRGATSGVSPFSSPVSDLTQVRVVPNPYSILGGDLSSGGTNFTGQPNKLLFVNLPANAIIRIFTLNGDLVTRLDHTSGSGDEEWELMANDNNQFIVSGMYVAHITDPATGESDIEKFLIVR